MLIRYSRKARETVLRAINSGEAKAAFADFCAHWSIFDLDL